MPLKPSSTIRAAVSMALCLSVWPCVTHAQVAVPAPIVPPSLGGLVPIQSSAPGGGLQSIQPITPPSIDGQTSISAAAVTAPAVMAQIEAGRLTPEKAWTTGALTVNDLIYILDRYVSEWGFISGMNNGMDQVELRRNLARLLAEHGGKVLTKPAALPAKARLWLTDYFMSIGDARAVTFGESILGEVKAPVGNEDALAFQTVERMGRYYASTSEWEKGAQTWLHMGDYYRPESRFIPDALREAALLYVRAGDVKKAHELYAQVPKYGNGWYSGLALFDQAQQLIGQGKDAEARRLLTQPVTGSGANQAQVALLALLGSSYYATGDFDLARHFSQEAVNRFEALPQAQQGNGLGAPAKMAQRTLQSIEQWTKEPIRCEPREVRLTVQKDPQSPMIQRLTVRTFWPVSLMVTSDNPLVKVRLLNDDEWGEESLNRAGVDNEKEVIVEIVPGEMLHATLLLRSPQYPKFQAQVPVFLSVRDK